ncbi:MAG: hypothetical protein ACHP7O_07585 [Burkholderiales bacterium]
MKKLLFAILVVCAPIANSADDKAPVIPSDVDPSVGSYLWFAALDQKCPGPNATRSTALEAYKRQFITNVRAIASGLPADNANKMLTSIDDLERNGPPKSSLEKFDRYFSTGSADEIKALCESAASDIAQWMQIQSKVVDANERAKKILERTK